MIFLYALLCVVFALSVGSAYASADITRTYGQNINSTSAYMGNQQYTIINDTTLSPVPFGVSGHNFEIAMQYAIDYDFDVRFEYSMSWSGGGSTDNVVLQFANRDNLMVDEKYIYVADKISAGSGKLGIINGVEFTDVNDTSYNGQSLSITLTAKISKIYKKTDANSNIVDDYSHAHILYTNTDAGNAWFAYKTGSTYVMVYNSHYSYDTGITHPGNDTAMSGTKWLGGDRFYGGVGIYVVAGATDFKLKASIQGIWRSSTGSTGIEAAENNIQYNYSDGWVSYSTPSYSDTKQIFENKYFNYTVQAGSVAYIQVVDNIEITSAGESNISNYDNHKLVTNSITINDQPFSYAEIDNATAEQKAALAIQSLSSDDGITSANVSPSGGNYSKSMLIYNQTSHDAGLYKAGSGQQTYYTNISLVNNTADTKTYALSYVLNYYIGNGYGSNPYASGNSKDLFKNTSDQYYSYQGTTANATYFEVEKAKTVVTLAPYSRVNVCERFYVTDAFAAFIKSDLGVSDNYDAWVQVGVTASTTSSTNADLLVETKVSGGNVTVRVKNPTQYTVSGNITVNLELFASSTFALQTISGLDSKFTGSNGTYTATALTLEPNETALVCSFTNNNTKFIIQGFATASATATPNTVKLVNGGTNDAYLINYSDESYYVRFSGQISANSSFVVSNGYNYYIGILRPDQIVKVAMTDDGDITAADLIVVNNADYSSATLSTWGDATVTNAFNDYFAVN